MKLFFDGNSIKPLSPSPQKNMNPNVKVKSLYATILVVLIATVAIFWGLNDVNAQSTQNGSIFKVIVQVVNNGNLDEHGTVHVTMDGSRSPHVLNNQIFPGLQTTPFTFEFSSDEAPVGKGFVAEVVFGDDEHKRAYGTNTPSKSPETATITIP
ncbi:MAG: hypothetical protein M3Y25_07050 [Thermoproteota archaeon]|nr:hypothetical protein [Thermoproteota archaeon]